MPKVYLDRGGINPLEQNALEINTEVDFLRHATDSGILFIRGERLCRWAEAFYKGRSIIPIEVISLAAELQSLCPDLSLDDVKSLLAEYSEKIAAIPKPLTVSNLLITLSPAPFWDEPSSISHLATYLIWLTENKPFSALMAVIRHWADICSQDSSEQSAILYIRGSSREEALEVVFEWLGIRPNHLDLPVFPLTVPTEIERTILETWRNEIISSGGYYFLELIKKPLPYQLKKGAAYELTNYLSEHPHHIKKEIVDQALPFLERDQQRKLLKYIPPALPKSMPGSSNEILEWFKEQYLPYRYWTLMFGTDEEKELLNKLALQFTFWYLDAYPRGLMGGALLEQVSFKRVENLVHEKRQWVVLVLALDGLGMVDARQLLLNIKESIPRLTIINEDACFCPLPTVTEFCKPSLLSGQPPVFSKKANPLGVLISPGATPVVELEKAQPGQVIFWYLGEPDRTYHKNMDPQLIQSEVESELKGVTAKLAQIIDQVSTSIPLEIVITTDHGRLLAQSHRKHSLSEGITTHGRAAWGVIDRKYESHGYTREGEIIFLDKETFALPTDVAISLTEDSFLMIDGRSGSDWSTHGGLYPEEVIIPWIELIRDAIPPKIDIKINGTGTASANGIIIVNTINPGDETIILQTLELHYSDGIVRTFSMNINVDAKDFHSEEYPVDNWPTKKQASTITGKVQAKTKNGLAFTTGCTVKLTSDEMYTTADDLFKDLF